MRNQKHLFLIAVILSSCAVSPKKDAGLEATLKRNNLQGKALDSGEDRPTCLVVFASWCGPCRHELEVLGSLRPKYPGVRFIGLNAYEAWGERSNNKQLRAFLATNAPWLEVTSAPPSLLKALGGVPHIPATFFYNRKGVLVRSFRRTTAPLPTKEQLGTALRLATEND